MAKVGWKNRDNIRRVVAGSKNRQACLLRLGLGAKGSNFRTLNKYIVLYDLSTEHFVKPWNHLLKLNGNKKISLSKVLVENSTYSRYHLKKRIIAENVIDYICDVCYNMGQWNGKELVLQLEHRNGIRNDDRVENLCFLCPNCHSQTSTFAGRNNKNEQSKTQVNKRAAEEKNKEKQKEKQKRLNFIKSALLNSSIDFSKFGWVVRVAPVIGITPPKVNGWMKRNMTDFYDECCFKKRVNKT